jgi:hypothetical protein
MRSSGIGHRSRPVSWLKLKHGEPGWRVGSTFPSGGWPRVPSAMMKKKIHRNAVIRATRLRRNDHVEQVYPHWARPVNRAQQG